MVKIYPNLEISKVVLVHCNIVNDDYQQDSIKPFGSSQQIFSF